MKEEFTQLRGVNTEYSGQALWDEIQRMEKYCCQFLSLGKAEE